MLGGNLDICIHHKIFLDCKNEGEEVGRECATLEEEQK
jgi:hypothetical protein